MKRGEWVAGRGYTRDKYPLGCSACPPDSDLPAGFALMAGGWVAHAAVAEARWSVAEWAVALRFDNPRATVPVPVLG